MTFGERLQQLRERTGLTQEKLAEVAGINVWTIRGYEQNRRQPDWINIIRLAHGLGITVEAFGEGVLTVKPKKERKGK